MRRGFTLEAENVGDGPARAGLEARAAELGITSRVTFTGLVNHDQLPEHVAAFDIALQPKAVDYASPLKIFEYMAAGKAIVAPDQPNIGEILANDENALLFSPDDAAAFRSAILRLAHDPELRQRLGAGASRAIRERRYTWGDNAARVALIAERLQLNSAQPMSSCP